jgi:phosphate transport system permease protein
LKHKRLESLFTFIIRFLAFLSTISLIFIIGFILKESIPLFSKISLSSFISGTKWMPVGNTPQVSILPMILSTVYISILSVIIALPLGLGCAVFLSCIVKHDLRGIAKPMIDMLSGIPSVIYGFMGLLIIVKFFEVNFSMASGESVLAGAVLLAIMILPFIISTCDESMVAARDKLMQISKSMGVSKWYAVSHLILPAVKKSILAAVVLSLGRALGETMAVMMVIGNSPIMPRLLGKAETIPALIALEMGTAQVGSLHYHALFGSGLVLMVLILLINLTVYGIRKNLSN